MQSTYCEESIVQESHSDLSKTCLSCTPCEKIDHVILQKRLQIIARNRFLRKEQDALPADDDIDAFSLILKSNSSGLYNNSIRLVSYDEYKECLRLAPESVRRLLSVKTFMSIYIEYRDTYDGKVPVSAFTDFICIKKERLRKMIALHYYDLTSNGSLTMQDLSNYIQNEIMPNIPSLKSLLSIQDDSNLLDYYLWIASYKFFFFLDIVGNNRIRIIDIVASNILSEFDSISEETEDSENVVPMLEADFTSKWFAKSTFLRVKCLFVQLDTDSNGLLNMQEIMRLPNVTEAFVRRLFEVQQTYDNNEIDLKRFCYLLLAMDNKSHTASLTYYFRILDVDGDGYLNSFDLKFFYRDIEKLMSKCIEENSFMKEVSFEDIRDEIFDMCRPADPYKITLKELINSGKGDVIIGILTDFEYFLDYEQQENIVLDEK